MTCKTRFKTEETLLESEPERAPRKPKVEKAPSISRAREKTIARKKARDEIEKRRRDKEANDWWNEDNNFLPDRW
jgi:hypothetical protein